MDRENLSEAINQLYRNAPTLSREEMIALTKMITDKYMEQTGNQIPPRFLEQLASLLLHEELTDQHPDKMSREAYPIMSEHQYKWRLSGEVFNRELPAVTGILIGHRALHRVDHNGRHYSGQQAVYRYPI